MKSQGLFKVVPNIDRYGMLEININPLIDSFGTFFVDDMRESMTLSADCWPCLKASHLALRTTVETHLSAPDIYVWNGCFLTLSDSAYKALYSLLAPLGSFYPFSIEDKPYHLLAIHHVIDGKIGSPNECDLSPVFYRRSIEFEDISPFRPALFKTPDDHYSNLYCNGRLANAFKTLHALEIGINFDNDLTFLDSNV